jgi:pantetheine-phosphate adenylyltransferase
MKQHIGLFAGSFDPPTLGHLDLIERAAKICDQLYVGIAVNSKKKHPTFSIVERYAMLTELCHSLKHVKIVEFEGLAVEFAKENKVDFLVRGLRSPSDFDSEMQMAMSNKVISRIDTVFLIANPLYIHISSTLIHEIAHGGHRLHQFVPESVEDAVYTRITLKPDS